MHYQAGDACGVIAHNDPALVEELLAHAAMFDADSIIETPQGRHGHGCATRCAHHLQPTRLSRKIVQHFAAKTGAQRN